MRWAALALVGAGLSVGAAGAGCRGRAVALALLDGGLTSGPVPALMPPTEEPNQIHFTIRGRDAVGFSWQGSGSPVRLWAKEIAPRAVEGHRARPEPISSAGPWQEAEVTGLLPGVDYGYAIGSPARPMRFSFRSPPARGASVFVFAAMGGGGASIDFPQARTTHRLITLAEPAFVLATGDLTFADSHAQTSVDRHFEDVMAWSRRAAYMPIWGEHEWQTEGRDDLRNYKGRFLLPNAQASPGAPASGCCGEDWYWFDYGNGRFIAYPEPYEPRTWDDWAGHAGALMDEAERDPALGFVVTFGHRSAYSSAPGAGDPQLRRILDDLGKRHRKYVLNLSGHDHVYERTKPQAHVVHISTGIGGAMLDHAPTPCRWPACTPPAFTAFRAIHSGFVKLQVRPGGVHVEAVCGTASFGIEDLRCGEGEIMDEAMVRFGG